jgi:membrane protease subunit HflK
MRAGIAETPFDEVYEGRRQAELQQRVVGRIQRALDAWRSGIRVDSLEVTRAAPPTRLAEAFKKVGATRAEIERDRKKALDWADQTLRIAQSEAAAFNRVYERYKLAPQVVRKRMYYETMERVLQNNRHIVIGGDPSLSGVVSAKPQGAGQ